MIAVIVGAMFCLYFAWTTHRFSGIWPPDFPQPSPYPDRWLLSLNDYYDARYPVTGSSIKLHGEWPRVMHVVTMASWAGGITSIAGLAMLLSPKIRRIMQSRNRGFELVVRADAGWAVNQPNSALDEATTALPIQRWFSAPTIQRRIVMWHRKSRQLDEFRRSALHYAAADGDADKARAELAAGADVNAADAGGWTPLHFAAQSQSAPIVRSLIEKGGSVDVPDAHGNTPLWRAVFAYQGDPTIIQLLRGADADPLRKNKHGVSPLSLARTIANDDVAKCFADLPPDAADAPADAPDPGRDQ